ncbi:uncharacterized protein isoform X3 [Choristoneura fumiferana]|uniref:uncharacterized protein isoform X3 n=1 Tax=Choristoneura fumiferana TaxID=7141 RepID=UPI003D155B0B
MQQTQRKLQNGKECDECTSGSCQRLPVGLPATKENKTWRTFDGSPERPQQKSSKTRVRIDPKPSSHLESIVVPLPVEKRPRKRPCDGGSNLKWYILALLGAIVIGVVIKKKLAA